MNVQIIGLLKDMIILFLACLAAFTFRGFFRALVAKWMGDNTAYSQGFMTLNPLVHVNVGGLSLMLLIVWGLGALLSDFFHHNFLFAFLVLMGLRWVYPVPFEPRNFTRIKLGMVTTILAGPFGYFLLTLVCLYVRAHFPFHRVPVGVAKGLFEIFTRTLYLSSFFGVFSFIPIPPFDGGRLLKFLLPYSEKGVMAWLEEYGYYVLLALFVLPVVRELFFGSISILSVGIVTLLSKLVF